MTAKDDADTDSKYVQVMRWVFKEKHKSGSTKVPFAREDLVSACEALGFPRIRNIGDIPYSFRFRNELPREVKDAAPKNAEWIISGTGIGTYEFRLASPGKIEPAANRELVKIPDATPEIVRQYAPGTDEQALLTRIRYNRLIDVFLSLTCYSIQNHLRTTVKNVGQIEVDEIYLGINKRGAHFVIPCQAKSPGDKFGIVQVMQDVALCRAKYPHAICRPVAVQFRAENDLAMLELNVADDNAGLLKLTVVEERHYRLVPRSDISTDELSRLSKMEDGYPR